MSWNTHAALAAAALTLNVMTVAWAGPLRPRATEAQRGGEVGLPADGARAASEARLALSKQAIDVIRRPARDGALFVGRREDFYRWSRRQLGDELFLSLPESGPRAADPEVYLTLARSRPSPVRVAAFEEHLHRMRELESAMLPLKEQRLLSALDFLEVQAHRLEAELWLAREREEGELAD
jgi:hypothetical protein